MEKSAEARSQKSEGKKSEQSFSGSVIGATDSDDDTAVERAFQRPLSPKSLDSTLAAAAILIIILNIIGLGTRW